MFLLLESSFFHLMLECNFVHFPHQTVADREGKTAFHWVASSDSVEVARVLLQASAATPHNGSQINLMNLQDMEGRSPLHLAVANADGKMVNFLLLNGVDVKLQDGHGVRWEKKRQQQFVLFLQCLCMTTDNSSLLFAHLLP